MSSTGMLKTNSDVTILGITNYVVIEKIDSLLLIYSYLKLTVMTLGI